MNQFKREDRYIVLKRKHLATLPNELQYRLKPALEDAAQLMPAMECVVVESDWPMFDATWRAIQAYAETGQWVEGQDHDEVLVDREVKASNLKTLVDMVLGYEDASTRAVESGGDGGDVFEAEESWRELLALARGLKQ